MDEDKNAQFNPHFTMCMGVSERQSIILKDDICYFTKSCLSYISVPLQINDTTINQINNNMIFRVFHCFMIECTSVNVLIHKILFSQTKKPNDFGLKLHNNNITSHTVWRCSTLSLSVKLNSTMNNVPSKNKSIML